MSSDAPIDIPLLPSRRDLLKAGGAALATGGVPGTGGVAQAAAGVRKRAASVDPMPDVEPFYGEHQGGIVTRTQAHTYLAAFDLTTTSRDKIWTRRTRTAIRSFPITRMCASQTACRTTVPRFCAVRIRYDLTPQWFVGAAYIYTQGKYDVVNRSPGWSQENLVTGYALSRRTDVFLVAIDQQAVGDADFTEIGTLPASSSRRQLCLELGFRHKF